jgi:hypothetical protein
VDARENDESRLEEGESIQLAGVTVVEVFTPSRVAALYEAMERWEQANQSRSCKEPGTLMHHLDNSRSLPHSGGWANLGHVVRTPSRWSIGMGRADKTLPAEVASVAASVSYVTSSVAVVMATFVFVVGAGDLSSILRADRQGRRTNARFTLPGRLGWLRARLPFARPKGHGFSSSWEGVFEQKRCEVAELTSRLEEGCAAWFRGQFPGRFASLPIDKHPLIQILVTEKKVPFTAVGMGRTAEDAAGIGSHQTAFRSLDGWAISTGDWTTSVRPHCWTMASRRAEAAAARTDSDTSGSNTAIVGWATGFQYDLPAALGLWALLELLARELAATRDRGRGRKAWRPARPVRDAIALNDYLLRGGLDTVTVTSDIAKSSTDPWFLTDAPKFLEDAPRGSESRPEATPANFIEGLRESLVARADRLRADAMNTGANLRASAELQQAIANTRMQRVALLFTILAIVIAVASLLLSI